ncbi:MULTISPECIES: helix-turn-helix transcriptional regulator [Actinosynnema]|uniref:helix-turn-helix domain-containing protein n=1 Tax=Actinosynnema TaxID=40566 RepID=UPI0020A3879E|nr:helix-turn-helix transcriptional regulator [Actinosynnema pretiosum]MCP2097436.1 Helix-turn-helix domain-containing protein [Actinosynnema pretiosum]
MSARTPDAHTPADGAVPECTPWRHGHTTPLQHSRLAQQHLAAGLRELRGTKLSTRVLARLLDVAQSTVSKYEAGLLLPAPTTVERLLDAMPTVPSERRAALLELARLLDSEAKNRRLVLHLGSSRAYQALKALQRKATRGLHFANAVIPAPLQTEDYRRAVYSTADPQETHDRHEGPQGPAGEFVLTESALRWRVGPPELMAAQIEHLRELARRPEVDLGVIPEDVVLPDTHLPHGFQVIDARAVTFDGYTAFAIDRDPDNIDYYTRLFTRLHSFAAREDALPPLLDRITAGFHTA